MRLKAELTQSDLKLLVINDLKEKSNFNIKPEDVHIEVKSKQNYKSQWEQAEYRARVEWDQ